MTTTHTIDAFCPFGRDGFDVEITYTYTPGAPATRIDPAVPTRRYQMTKYRTYSSGGTIRAGRKLNLAELVRPAAPVAGNLGSHIALSSYLWNVTIAPDADLATRSAAAIESRAVTAAIRAIRGY